MKTIYYGSQEFIVANDLANEIMRASTEFGSEGRLIQIPIACYRGNEAAEVSVIVGAGIPVMFADSKSVLDDPPRTLEAWSWIRDEIDALQSDQ